MPRSNDTVKTAASSSAAAEEEEAAQAREVFDVEVLPWAEVPAWHVGLWRKSKGRGWAGVVGGSAVRCARGGEDPAVVAARLGPDDSNAGNSSDDNENAGGAEDLHHLWSPAAGVEGKGFVWDATRELRAKGATMQLAMRPDGAAVAHPVSTHTYVGRGVAERATTETEAAAAYPLLWEVVSAVHPLRFACWSATQMPAVVRADNTVHFPLELSSGEGRSVPVAPLDVGRYAYCLTVWERSEGGGQGGGGGSGGAAFVAAVQFEDELRLYTLADGAEGAAARFRLVLSIPCGLWLARSSCFAGQEEREKGERTSNETLPGLISPDALVFNNDGTLLLLCALDGCAVFGLQWGIGGGGGDDGRRDGGEEASRVSLTAWPVCRSFFRNRVAGGVFASATRCLLFSRFPARLTLWDVFASEVVWAATVCTAPLHSIAYRPFRPAGGDAHEHQWPTSRPLPCSNQPWMCSVCRNRQPSSARCAECACGAKCCRVCAHVHAWGGEREGPGEAWRCGVCDGRMRVADRAHPCTKCRAWACEVCARGTTQEPEERPAAVFLAGSRGVFAVVLPQQPGGDGGRRGTARAMHPEWQHGAFAAHAVPAQGAVFRSRAAVAQRRRGGGAKRKASDDDAGGSRRRRRAPELHSLVESDSSSESVAGMRGGSVVATQPLRQGFVPAPYQAPHAAPRVLEAARHEAPRLYPVVSIAGEALQTSLSATPMPTDPRKVSDLMQQLLRAARPVQGTWSGQQMRSSGRLRLIPPHGVKPFSLRGCTSTIRYARDGSLFLLFTRDTLGVGEVVVVSGKTGAVRFRLCIPPHEVSKLALICLSAAVMRLATVDGTHVTCYDIVSNGVVWQSTTPVPLGEANFTHMALTPTGCVLVPELPLHTRVDIHTLIASDWGSDDCTAVATCSKLNHAWLPLASPANVVHFAKMEGLRDLFKRGLSLVPASTEFSDALVDVFLA